MSASCWRRAVWKSTVRGHLLCNPCANASPLGRAVEGSMLAITLIGITFSGREVAIVIAVIAVVVVAAWFFLRRRR